MESVKTFGAFMLAYLPVILVFAAVAFWINMLVRTLRRKAHEAKVRKVKVGDRVRTIKGLEGTVVSVGKDTVDLEYDEHCASFVFEAIKDLI